MPKRILVISGEPFIDLEYEAFECLRKDGHLLYNFGDIDCQLKADCFESQFFYNQGDFIGSFNYIVKQGIKFDAVVARCYEAIGLLVAAFVRHFGTTGNDPQTAFNCRSKYQMRTCLNNNGLPVVRTVCCKSFDEIASAHKKLACDCVVKPIAGQSSFGVFMIKKDGDPEEWRPVYESAQDFLRDTALVEKYVTQPKPEELKFLGLDPSIDMLSDYVVEEFIPGSEISLDSIVQDGEAHVMLTAEQIRMTGPYFMQLAERVPFQGSADLLQNILDINQKSVEALGIKNSATHVEIILSPAGPKVVEIGGRMGGDNTIYAVNDMTGYNMMYEMVKLGLGIQRPYHRQLSHPFVLAKKFIYMAYVLPDVEGIFRGLVLPECETEDLSVELICVAEKTGIPYAPIPKGFDYLGYVQAKADSLEKAEKAVKDALSRLRVLMD